MELPVVQNINMGTYPAIARQGFISLQREKAIADRYVKNLTIRTPSINQKVNLLSGGNQQKVVVGRWLNKGSKVFIFDEPTVGVDVGAKAEIYRLFEELIQQGNSILIVSSYLPEVMNLSDRILVCRQGRVVEEISPAEATEEKIMFAAVH